ncbi:glycosyltransferase [Alistipes sp.]|uniref:glycosyltransferase n=1 Tax=Alistipes sp. TaxID=1872444 RepID=UPI003AEF4EBC
MKPKIIFIDAALNPGGAERILCTLIRNADFEKYEIEVVITGQPGEMCALLPSAIQVTYLNIKRSRYAWFALAKYFRVHKPDAVFAVSYTSAYAALLARIFTRKKFRISVRHCLMPRQMIQEGFIKPTKVRFKIDNWLMKRLDCIIAEHQYMENELHEILHIPRNRLTYVLNPLDEPLIKKQISESFELPTDQINVVAAGRINREKGFDFLVEAFGKVVKRDARFHLYIIGKNIDNNQSELKAIAKDYLDHIHFEGFQSNPYKYFKAADLYVLSSRWEASPNVVFENLYLGKRIVATACSPILNDILGSNGILVPFGDTETMAQAILNFLNYSRIASKFYSLDEFYDAIMGKTNKIDENLD